MCAPKVICFHQRGDTMIEIVYKDENAETEEKKDCVLPKNIRQIGEGRGGMRIYLEDFAYTYLMKAASAVPEKGKICLLLGCQREKSGEPILFIRSAFWLDQLEVDMEHMQLQDAVWNEAEGIMEKNFQGQEILGWSVILSGCGLVPTGIMTQLHLNHFSRPGQVLFLMDAAEKEESFFTYENGRLVKQEGYYIYYEENRPMQEYMIAHNPLTEGRVGEPADKAVQEFRKTVDRKKQEPVSPGGQLIRVAAAACVVFTIAAVVQYVSRAPERIGTEAVNVSEAVETNAGFETSQKLYNEESLLPQTDGAAEKSTVERVVVGEMEGASENDGTDQNNTNDPAVTAGENPGETTDTENMGTEGMDTENINAENKDTAGTDTGNTDTEETDEGGGKETQQQNGTETGTQAYATYQVKRGDTISSISQMHYGSLDKIEEICKINNIESEDLIYVGQIILLP